MSLNRNLKLSLAICGVIVAAVLAFVVITITQASPPAAAPSAPSGGNAASVLRPDTRILDDAGEEAVVLVEFLDFECEACGAFYPYVEELREEFAGEVTFAFRYFPLPGHVNSTNAAIAVEAAAQQGELEEMFAVMYENQAAWGESQDSKAALFRQYAEQIGLDMVAYDEAVASPATAARVRADFEAGIALGVQSTPTFFLNDRPLALTSFEDLRSAIESEVRR